MDFHTLVAQIQELEQVHREDELRIMREQHALAAAKKELIEGRHFLLLLRFSEKEKSLFLIVKDVANTKVNQLQLLVQNLQQQVAGLECADANSKKVVRQLKDALKDSKNETSLANAALCIQKEGMGKRRAEFAAFLSTVSAFLRSFLNEEAEVTEEAEQKAQELNAASIILFESMSTSSDQEGGEKNSSDDAPTQEIEELKSRLEQSQAKLDQHIRDEEKLNE